MNTLARTYSGSFSPLKARNFRIYLFGQAFSLIGTWMQTTAQAWVVWELTHSESALDLTVMFSYLLASSGAGAFLSTLVLLPLSQALRPIGLIVCGAAL